MAEETLKLTTEHRIAALERENVVLRDKMRILHGMLKQQKQLINEYITQQILTADGDEQAAGDNTSSETLGSFLCRQRFEQMERRLDELGAGVPEEILRRRAV
jgi:hypothetical protein